MHKRLKVTDTGFRFIFFSGLALVARIAGDPGAHRLEFLSGGRVTTTFSLSDAKGAWSYDCKPESGAGEGESHLNSLTRSGGFGDLVILQLDSCARTHNIGSHGCIEH